MRVTRATPFWILLMASIMAAMVWIHFTAIDGFAGAVFGAILTDETEYARGYSEAAFRSVRPGMTVEEVKTLVGPLLGESWAWAGDCWSIHLERERVVYGCEARGITPGMSASEVPARLASPNMITWLYSKRRARKDYRTRAVTFQSGRVTNTYAEWYF